MKHKRHLFKKHLLRTVLVLSLSLSLVLAGCGTQNENASSEPQHAQVPTQQEQPAQPVVEQQGLQRQVDEQAVQGALQDGQVNYDEIIYVINLGIDLVAIYSFSFADNSTGLGAAYLAQDPSNGFKVTATQTNSWDMAEKVSWDTLSWDFALGGESGYLMYGIINDQDITGVEIGTSAGVVNAEVVTSSSPEVWYSQINDGFSTLTTLDTNGQRVTVYDPQNYHSTSLQPIQGPGSISGWTKYSYMDRQPFVTDDWQRYYCLKAAPVPFSIEVPSDWTVSYSSFSKGDQKVAEIGPGAIILLKQGQELLPDGVQDSEYARVIKSEEVTLDSYQGVKVTSELDTDGFGIWYGVAYYITDRVRAFGMTFYAPTLEELEYELYDEIMSTFTIK